MEQSLHTIYKYPLGVYDSPGSREIEVDCISVKPLAVAEQRGELTLWALVEVGHGGAGHATHTMQVDIIGIGHPILIEDLEGMAFIGSVVMRSTPYVWHVYASEGVLQHVYDEGDLNDGS